MIGIINYGVGNIKAFYNLYNEINIKIKVIDNYKDLNQSIDKLILPGVGSFDEAIRLLKKKNFFDEIKNFSINKKNKILGVCVGMQILAENSEEGNESGLSLVEGNILKFSKGLLPQMGWNNVNIKKNDLILKEIKDKDFFYFLHSYYFKEKKENDVIAASNYHQSFTSILKRENIYGVQFHPEKSHIAGLKFLKNFNNI
jgi:imidazole glycerol-phosphate synthase subunit HisH